MCDLPLAQPALPVGEATATHKGASESQTRKRGHGDTNVYPRFMARTVFVTNIRSSSYIHVLDVRVNKGLLIRGAMNALCTIIVTTKQQSAWKCSTDVA